MTEIERIIARLTKHANSGPALMSYSREDAMRLVNHLAGLQGDPPPVLDPDVSHFPYAPGVTFDHVSIQERGDSPETRIFNSSGQELPTDPSVKRGGGTWSPDPDDPRRTCKWCP